MTLTVKLEPALEALIAARCRAEGSTKSAIVQEALRAYLERNPKSAFELGKEVFGKRGSGRSDLSERRHDYYADLANAKRRSRR
jgi:hypothetical protein